jgi:hypothetical protein
MRSMRKILVLALVTLTLSTVATGGCSSSPSAPTSQPDAAISDATLDGPSFQPDAATSDGTSSVYGSPDSAPDSGVADAAPGQVRGSVGKGPFVLGSTVTISPVNTGGMQTGQVFTTSTTDDVGDFSLAIGVSGPVSLQAAGFYFNEVTGSLSLASITLRAWANLDGAAQVVNINTVTHLAYGRIQTLTAGGASLDAATAQAESELRMALDVGPASFNPGAPGTAMTFAGGDTPANEYLVAISAVIEQAAVTQAGPTGSVDAEVQEILDEISSDLAPDGMLTPSVVTQLQGAEQALDTYAVRDNLAVRLSAVGVSATVPNVDMVIDTDLDGVPNATDNCRLVYNPAQQKINSVCAYRNLFFSNPTNVKAVTSMAIGDVNGDGLVDVAFGGVNVGALVFLGTGSAPNRSNYAGFAYSATWDGDVGYGDLVARDVTGDGIADLIGCDAYYLPGGAGSHAPVSFYAANGSGVDVHDYNGDDRNDIAYSSSMGVFPVPPDGGAGTMPLLNTLVDGGAAFVPAFPGVPMQGTRLTAGLLNGDAYYDLVGFAGQLGVAMGHGDGTFGTPTSYTVGGSGGALGDFNGDGHVDIAVLVNPQDLRILLGDGQGGFFGPDAQADAGATLQGFDIPISAAVTITVRAAEMSGDNIDDLIVYDRAGNVHVLVSSGSGLATEVLLKSQPITSSFDPAFAVGDLDADGTADVVAEDVGGIDTFLVFR